VTTKRRSERRRRTTSRNIPPNRTRIWGVHASSANQDVALGLPVRRWYRAAGGRDEAALIRQARRGSADAVEALVRSHWDAAHRTAFLILRDAGAAEDVAQEAMLAAVAAIDRFDRRRPFRPWLHRIVVNRSLDLLRARAARPELITARTPEPVNDSESGLPGELMAALGKLEPEERALIVMRHLLDYRSTEIASLLELPAATVRTRLRRALGRLRELLEQEEGS
jgi:RNA polymerase sigma-70 factor, ECF subfamily